MENEVVADLISSGTKKLSGPLWIDSIPLLRADVHKTNQSRSCSVGLHTIPVEYPETELKGILRFARKRYIYINIYMFKDKECEG
jgi:hypothetical protein